MTKLRRTASAFASRVKMSSIRLWLIVEGKSHDRSFYDVVLRAHPQLGENNYRIRLSEQIELDGKSAGGKKFALSLYEYFKNEGQLRQTADQGTRLIAFALDRDLDQIAEVTVEDKHILYTEGMDIEAEILRRSDLLRAASATFSIPLSEVSAVLGSASNVFDSLAHLYREWIVAGAVSICGTSGAWRAPGSAPAAHRYSQLSEFNQGAFGPVDDVLVNAARAEVEAYLAELGSEERIGKIEALVASFYDGGAAWLIVKGRWVERYVCHLIYSHFVDDLIESVQPTTLTKAAMATVSPHDSWTDYYFPRIDALISEVA